MSFLKSLVNEMAAGGTTCASAVAAAPGGLFKGGVVRRKKRKNKVKETYRLNPKNVPTVKNENSWKWRVLGEMINNDDSFDQEDVMSKLNSAEKKADAEEDTVPFGMEDEEGNIVKVYVRAEQADEFESALASMLAGEDDDENDQNTAKEIAEVLFELKDKFDIVDVDWPQIEGDEEEEQSIQGEEEMGELDDMAGGEEGGDPEAEGGDEDLGDLEDTEGEIGGEEDMDMAPEEDPAASALNQVIDMMKADAEARKAESEARAKEAEARAAEAQAQMSASKVKQEEDVLDMEAYNKNRKSEEEEVKRIASLAKWKHDQASEKEVRLSQEEEERSLKNDSEWNRMRPAETEDDMITKKELLGRIMDYLQRN